MPTHKQSLTLLSLSQLSELTGHTYRTIKKKLSGLDPEDQDGRTLLYNSREALEIIYYGTPEERMEDGDDGHPKKIDIRYETGRNMKLKNEHLEHDLKVKRGEYLPRVDVETWLTNKILGFRARLRTLATSLAPQIHGKKEKQIEDILNRAHDEALAEMAIDEDREPAEGVDEEGFEEASSAAESDDISVG